MHDVIGNAGMLRGWIAVWTMQMVWLFVALAFSIGATAMMELLMNRGNEPARVRHRPRIAPPLA